MISTCSRRPAIRARNVLSHCPPDRGHLRGAAVSQRHAARRDLSSAPPTPLTWKKADTIWHFTHFRSPRAMSKIMMRRSTRSTTDQLINRTWERRSEITPDYETRQRPPLMTIYKLLPQTNCKQCGEPTCYSFAIKLVAAQKKISDCPLLPNRNMRRTSWH